MGGILASSYGKKTKQSLTLSTQEAVRLSASTHTHPSNNNTKLATIHNLGYVAVMPSSYGK